MKKLTLLFSILTTAGAFAQGDDEPAPTPIPLMSCTVTELRPEFADFFAGVFFMGPQVGDVTTIDLNQNAISDIKFESGSQLIAGMTTLNKSNQTQTSVSFEGTHKSVTSDYIGTILARLGQDNATANITAQFLRKRFRAGLGQIVSQMSLHEAVMECTAIVPAH